MNKIYADYVNKIQSKCTDKFSLIEDISLYNQEKVLNAFKKNNIAVRHFTGTTGYGYDDIGREALCKVYSDVFNTEAAIVSPSLASGTHTISTAFFGILRPGDTLLSITGKPYDTLESIISGDGIGSLKDFNIKYKEIAMIENRFDISEIETILKTDKSIKLILIQRSRGYEWREALSIEQIASIVSIIKNIRPEVSIMADNCYGEFVEKREPSDVGVDITVGSLIKNPGGGLAPTGGYIAGKQDLIEKIGFRMTAPGVGTEIGSYLSGYQYFFQGLFLAPHTVGQALKGCVLASSVFNDLGYEVLPLPTGDFNDIITSIKFNDRAKLIKFCQAVQASSPIDSFVKPEPWGMPGYSDQVIMAAGTFVGGASIELSCDSPLRSPYIAYLQGGLTFEHFKLAIINCLDMINQQL